MSMIGGVDSNSSERRWGTVLLFSAFGLVSLSMIVLIVLSLLVPPAMNDLVERYTVMDPQPLPVVRFTDDEKEELEGRLGEFKDALVADDMVSSMELSAQELNVLVSGDDGTTEFHLSLVDGELVAQMSIPLENDLKLGPWRSSVQGRYISGVARLELEIRGDLLAVDLLSFTVKGKLVPNWLKRVLQREIDAMDWLDSDDVREVVGRLKDISIEGGQLILEPKIIDIR